MKIKPGDGKMINTEYEGIESLIEIERMFDLMNYHSKNLSRAQFSVSSAHSMIEEQIKHSLVIRVDDVELERGITSFGLLSLLKWHKVGTEEVDNILAHAKGSRERININKLIKECDNLGCNHVAVSMLEKCLGAYGDNKYGEKVRERTGLFCNLGSKNIVIPEALKNICKNIADTILDDRMYQLKKSSQNQKIIFRFSTLIYSLTLEFKKHVRPYQALSDIYRAGYITGLHTLSKHIINNTIPKDEYNFCQLTQKLSMMNARYLNEIRPRTNRDSGG